MAEMKSTKQYFRELMTAGEVIVSTRLTVVELLGLFLEMQESEPVTQFLAVKPLTAGGVFTGRYLVRRRDNT